MGLFNNIQNALTSRLTTVPGLPIIAHPNSNYKPEENTSYVRPTLLPAKSELYGLEFGRHQGIYQVDIFTTIKKGTAPILLIADSVREHFLEQLELVSGSDTVFIQEISISPSQRVEGWWSCSVEINYICFN